MPRSDKHFPRLSSMNSAPSEIQPEKSLAIMVVRLALIEATGKYSRKPQTDPKMLSETLNRQKDAIQWIREGGEDFQFWCELAGINPDHVRTLLKAQSAKIIPIFPPPTTKESLF